jgi:hypothetical protein
MATFENNKVSHCSCKERPFTAHFLKRDALLSADKPRICHLRLFLAARGLFFFCHLVVPNIIAQAKFTWQGLGFANADFATFVQKFLNKRIIRGFFWDMFHEYLPTLRSACLSRTIPSSRHFAVNLIRQRPFDAGRGVTNAAK